MRDTEANEWDGVHITGYDTMLPSEELHHRHEKYQYYPSNQL